ncbi:hypothetical protein ACJX0J_037138, partial [Zea mays]
ELMLDACRDDKRISHVWAHYMMRIFIQKIFISIIVKKYCITNIHRHLFLENLISSACHTMCLFHYYQRQMDIRLLDSIESIEDIVSLIDLKLVQKHKKMPKNV